MGNTEGHFSVSCQCYQCLGYNGIPVPKADPPPPSPKVFPIKVPHPPQWFIPPITPTTSTDMKKYYDNGKRRCGAQKAYRAQYWKKYLSSMRQKTRYTSEQKEQALNYLRSGGMTHRYVAHLISPCCSPSTTFRWKRHKMAEEEYRESRLMVRRLK